MKSWWLAPYVEDDQRGTGRGTIRDAHLTTELADNCWEGHTESGGMQLLTHRAFLWGGALGMRSRPISHCQSEFDPHDRHYQSTFGTIATGRWMRGVPGDSGSLGTCLGLKQVTDEHSILFHNA